MRSNYTCEHCGKITASSHAAACEQCDRVVFSVETAREMIEGQGWEEIAEVQWLLGEIELLAELLGVKI